MTKSSLRARQPLSRVNLTGFTMPISGKNRKHLSIHKKKTSLKTGKTLKTAQKFLGSCSPRPSSRPVRLCLHLRVPQRVAEYRVL